MNTTTLTKALAHTEWEQKTEGHGAVGVTVDVATLQKMMHIIEVCDVPLRRTGCITLESDGPRAQTIMRIAKEMRKARRDWKKFLQESSKETKA